MSNNNRPSQLLCQYCDKRGHDAKCCFKLFPHLHQSRPSAHHTTVPSPTHAPWIVDSGASHHVLQQPYEGPNDIQIGDGSGLSITHTGSTFISPSFSLSNVLCRPSINQNLISVAKFCRSNHTSIEFLLFTLFLRICAQGLLCSTERIGMISMSGPPR